MKTTKKRDTAVENMSAAEVTKFVQSNEKEPIIPRLGVPFDPVTGKIVFDGMRPSTKEKIRVLLDDARIAKELGIGSNAVASAENDAFAALVVNVLYDAIGSLAVIMAKSRGYGEHAEILRYTEQEKASFAAPTIAVLNEFDLLGGKHANKLLLLAAVGTVTAGHIAAMQQAAASRATITTIRESEKVS